MESDAAGGDGDEAVTNWGLQSIVAAYTLFGPDPTNVDIHSSIGVAHDVKARVESALVASPVDASIVGRIAANLAVDHDVETRTAAGDYVGSIISTQELDDESEVIPATMIDMTPYLGASNATRRAVRTHLRESNTNSPTADLLMEVFVTLSDVRGLLLVPAHDQIVYDDGITHDLRSLGPPAEATSELILARSIQFVPTSATWWAYITPLTHWGEHVKHLSIWALPQSLSLDPYPVGFIANPTSVGRQENRTIRIKFDHIIDCAWEQATYVVVDTDGRQLYAPLLQLTSQIQLARVSEGHENSQLSTYFEGRASSMSVTLLVRRLVWFVSLGLDIRRADTAQELILSNEWIARPVELDILHQWRHYKCAVISQLAYETVENWSNNTSRYVRFNRAPSRHGNTWTSGLDAAVSPFQLNLVIYSQVYFKLKAFENEASHFSNHSFFHSALRRAMSRVCLWSDASTTATMANIAAAVAPFVAEADAVDVSMAGSPPYTKEAPAAAPFSEQCIQMQKRLLTFFLGRLNRDKLIYRSQSDLQVTYDSRFANAWSTLYSSLNPPTISPLVTRRQTPARLPNTGAAIGVSDAKAYSAAYESQRALLDERRYVAVGGANPTRPSIPAPERHPNPRMRLLNTYVRHLWSRRRADYLDDEHDEDSATRSWRSFMEMINREMPHLRALHLLAIGMNEDRFFEMVQDALLQATPLPRVKKVSDAPGMLRKYAAADSYKCLLRWLVKSTPDRADDPPLAPLDEAEWLRVLNQTTSVYDKTKLEYDRPKLPMLIAPTEPLLLRRHTTLDEATSIFVQTPTNRALEDGETSRSLNRDPNKQMTISSGLNRAKVVTTNYFRVETGYDIPSIGLAMEDALIHKKVGNSHFWQDDPKFKVEKSALSWAGQNRLTELALIKYRRMYVDGTIEDELPWKWSPSINRAAMHGFRRFLAHHYLPSSVLIDAAMLQSDENAKVDYMNTTLMQLAWASLVYGGFRAPNTMQMLLQDTTALAIMWFQSAEEARQFSSRALASPQLAITRIATVGNDASKDPIDILDYCGRDIALTRVADGTEGPLHAFCADCVDEFLVDPPPVEQTTRADFKKAMTHGLLMDMMSGASLGSIHAMHMLECITFRHEPDRGANTAAVRAAECAWIGFDAPPHDVVGDAIIGAMQVEAQPLEEGGRRRGGVPQQPPQRPMPFTTKTTKKAKNKATKRKERNAAAMDIDGNGDGGESDDGPLPLPFDDDGGGGGELIEAPPAKRQRVSSARDDPVMAMAPPPRHSFVELHTAAENLSPPMASSARRRLEFTQMQSNIAFVLNVNSDDDDGGGGGGDNSPLIMRTSASVSSSRQPTRSQSQMDSSDDVSVEDFADLPRFFTTPTVEQLMAYNNSERTLRSKALPKKD